VKQFRLLIWGSALLISALSTFLISFIDGIPNSTLWFVFLIIFGGSLLFLSITIQSLMIQDLKKIEVILDNWLEDPTSNLNAEKGFYFTRFKRIGQSMIFAAEQKQEEIDELEKLSDFRREFIANISHELKTPIFSAQGFVHTLLDGAVKDKNVRNKFLKKAAKSLDALDLLVQDLLTLSQIEIGDIKMHFEYFDIVKLAQEVVEQLEEQAAKKIVNVFVKPARKQILVFADYQRIHQVLNNLIINAIKYNKEGGWVKVSFREVDDFVEVKVTDTGEGIPEEHLDRIFERFYRVEKSRSRRGGGTGLGLAIVKHVMEGHKTLVTVKSKVGQGTAFSFKLAKGEETMQEILER
jgi:two-component system phosphate regulon sensor histidine kinase PhoR